MAQDGELGDSKIFERRINIDDACCVHHKNQPTNTHLLLDYTSYCLRLHRATLRSGCHKNAVHAETRINTGFYGFFHKWDKKWDKLSPDTTIHFFNFFYVFCLNPLTRVVDSTMFPHVSRMEQFRSRQKPRTRRMRHDEHDEQNPQR